MQTIEGILLEGKLGRFISQGYYNIDVTGFEKFTEEAHLYALLEWSRYLRPDFSEKDRLKYLYEKCCEYANPNKFVKCTIIDIPYGSGYAVELEEEDDDVLPF